MLLTDQEKLQAHYDYWENKTQKRPLALIRLGHVFFSKEYKASDKLLETPGTYVTPDMINVDEYLPDVERMYQELKEVDCDSFFSAEPMTGFPWIEGMFGAKVKSTKVSFVTEPGFESMDQLADLKLDENNGWYRKYLEFAEKLDALSDGRFPVGEPILRGATDTVAALVGSSNMVLGTFRQAELTKKVFDTIVAGQRKLIEEQYKRVRPFYDGYTMAFYYLWAPGKAMWYQEDQVALLGPRQFKKYLLKTTRDYLEGYNYSLVHLHPNAFFEIDELLKIPELSVLELNKDHGGPTIREMAPICTKIIEAGKKVVVGMGPVDEDDIDALYDCYPDHGVAVNIVAENAAEANRLMDYMNSRHR